MQSHNPQNGGEWRPSRPGVSQTVGKAGHPPGGIIRGHYPGRITVISCYDTIQFGVSSKHRKTLEAVFENPVRADLRWQAIEGMLGALGAEISEGRGSRVRVALAGVRAVFHRPHPRPETDRGAIRALRRFLLEAGVSPEGSPE